LKPFIHIITTRFNVPTANWDITRDGETPLTEKWHEHRFEHFQKYTMRSFINQSNQDFEWFVFFDINTKQKYKKIIENIERQYPKFTPIFIPGFPDKQAWIYSHINLLKIKTNYIISSDIDNDDLLHRNFVATVQSMFVPRHDQVIDVRTGIQLLLNENKPTAYLVNMAASPFVSLVEEVNVAKSVIKEPYHSSYRYYSNYSYYDAEPLFIQFIHSYNLVNDIITSNKQLYQLDCDSFGINSSEGFKISFKNSFFHNMRRGLRILHKKLFK